MTSPALKSAIRSPASASQSPSKSIQFDEGQFSRTSMPDFDLDTPIEHKIAIGGDGIQDVTRGSEKISADLQLKEAALLALLETGDVVSISRAMLERGFEKNDIDSYISQRTEEIESVCNSHFQDLLRCVDELLNVRADAGALKNKIVDVNDEVQDSGEQLLERGEELVQTENVIKNLSVAMDLMDNYHKSLGLCEKGDLAFKAGKHIVAVESLLSGQQLLNSIPPSPFHGYISRSIPGSLNKIKAKVMEEFSAWLSSFREQSKTVGTLALRQKSRLISKEEALKERLKEAQRKAGGHAMLVVPADDDGAEELTFGSSNMFAPVFQAVCVYSKLGIPEEFRSHYKKNRQLQLSQDLHPPGPFIDCYEEYFAQVAGFFIMENKIGRSMYTLFTMPELEDLWRYAVQKIEAVLDEQTANCTNLEVLRKIKEMVYLLAETLLSNNVDVSPLMTYMQKTRNEYLHVVINKTTLELREVFDNEKHEPITIHSIDEYKQEILAFGLADAQKKLPDFPLTLAFSQTVPTVCRIVERFLTEYFSFVKGMPDTEAALLKALDEVIGYGLFSSMEYALDNCAAVSQAAQLFSNTAALVDACAHFEQFANELLCTDSEVKDRLSGGRALETSKTHAEDVIYQTVVKKIDELLTLSANMEWLPSQAPQDADDWILDLLTFLTTTFMCLDYVPDHVKEQAYWTACRHICKRFFRFLTDKNMKRWNIYAIQNLRLDLVEILNFANGCPVDNLVDAFDEILQFLSLVLDEGFEAYLEESTRQIRFGQLTPDNVILVMEKFKEVSNTAPGLPKLKKSFIDGFVKQVRAQIQEKA